jgi:flagellar motor switch protein FliG
MDHQARIVEVLHLLGERVSDQVLSSFSEEERTALRERLRATRPQLSLPRQLELLNEFESYLRFAVRTGAIRPRLYSPAAGDDGEEAPVRPAKPLSPRSLENPLAAMSRLSPYQLGRALETEQSRTVAILLGQMPAKFCAEVLSVLPEAQQALVVKDLSRSLPAPPVLVERIARTTLQRAAALPAVPPDRRDHLERLAEVLRSMPKAMARQMLASIQEEEPETAQSLTRKLYQFEDLAQLDKSLIQRLLAEVDKSTLSTALFQAPEEVTQRLFENLSRRARQTLQEEMQFQSHVPEVRVKHARDTIVEIIARLDQEEA